MKRSGSDLLDDAVITRAKSAGRLTRGQWAKAGLVAARAASDRADRAMLLDILGVTQILDLPLPLVESGPRKAGR